LGREYIIEGHIEGLHYVQKGYIIANQDSFIALLMLYHISEESYAEDYLDDIYNTLVIN